VASGQLEHRAQRGAVDELQHEDGPVLLGLEVVERADDARMVEKTDQPCFVGQHGSEPWVSSPLGRKQLEHHAAAELSRTLQLGEPHLAHAAETEPLLE